MMEFKTDEGVVEITINRKNSLFEYSGLLADLSDGASIIIDGKTHNAHLAKVGDVWWVHVLGHTIQLELIEPGANSGDEEGSLVAPMPGKILQVFVAEGERVNAGQALMVMEAMKMEHRIVATHDAIVDAVHYNAGDQVMQGAELLTLSE